MRILRHPYELPASLLGGSLALGNFDGVHRGHQRVIGSARAIAAQQGLPLGVMTFAPHPRRFFQPDLPPFTLTSFRLKAHLISEEGADFLYVQAFDEALSKGSAEWFVTEVLVKGLHVAHVVVGQDYAFGHRRQGTVSLLQKMALDLGFGVTAVAPVKDEGGAIYSSTRVRACLQEGDVTTAAQILGHPWEVEGRVEHGDKRGRTIGFPTANLKLGDYQRPRAGVYAVTAGLDDGAQTRFRPGVANFGRRPTFDNGDALLEVHLFDVSPDLYGRHLRVRFHDFLRPEQTFPGLEALKAQIGQDAAQARALFGLPPAAP
ncbi:bifunctional riboflavin kinase/FAD synthetase [Rhodospirillum rubrum]|uniref:Riboflavin biosynthesis protein n=1 Tax=Rhodospirillum rubrum (strain ATCC 11170 / ATH 1.1.1 / DSM 467 / LMG 4362 / NCIMB 8255 / S1) TaxID=269796 RepID=Q2RQ35_RHORT|nr:bifunctional riboflavin kinase/FAD synthetase [Rhodospirillum rubrum]ABC23760.1 FMN adenylyltransferase / riboflavin kinase [Rhodospirillum rubrum ATCC 11170]AEO49500.1 FMN adenylyltransferase / riboflavin kinase [Rhodospirillum rubrum F11]MBK5955439.1 riboflavin biosynthesis protein RibF [Rhodospirillum rubrum]QXG79712.1 bifunctional riboflavin kinase/FAD synthetase [Rhodospirillum rubrum]HCF17082.1 bifunctional riboflavin kinase/FAD synthetase [Rhodospirillum rubrum]